MPSRRKAAKKPYDNRSPEKISEEKASMAKILNQVNHIADDLPKFSKNVQELIRNAEIPTHLNLGEGKIYVVAAFSRKSEEFFREKEQNIIGKPVWHFRTLWGKHKISIEHRSKFLKSQEAITELLAQGKPLPDTHVATKFGEKTECFIAHFHREYVYDKTGKILGHLVFVPVEEITYEHFLLLEAQDSVVVDEEATILNEIAGFSESAGTKKGFYNLDQALDKMEIEAARLSKKLGLE